MLKLKVKYKSKLSSLTSIDKRNALFDSLSDEDKRKEIAWDGLQLLINETVRGSISADNFRYWSNNLECTFASDSKDFQLKLNNLNNLTTSCHVCARGAIMLSSIRLGNSISPDNPHKSRGIGYNNESLAKGFSVISLLTMEEVYENDSRDYNHYPYSYDTEKDTKTKRLINMLCNVIVNGDFDEEDLTDYIEHDSKPRFIDKIKKIFNGKAN